MKAKTIIFLLVTAITLTSCVFIHYNDNKSLGGGYYYVYDKPSSIILSEDEGKSGTLIIPSLTEVTVDYSSSVINYNFDENYIIAKTKDEDQIIKYWFLEKSTHLREEPLQPMDSVEFYRFLSAKNIPLTFED